MENGGKVKKDYQEITPETWVEIRKAYIENGLGPMKLAEMFGVKIGTIKVMCVRRGWHKEREIYRVQRGIEVEDETKAEEEGIRSRSKYGKAGCIESTIEIVRGLLIKMEARVRTLSSTDDKEMGRLTDSICRLYDTMERLLGIGKGEGNQDKVKPNQVQAEVLESAMEAVDALKALKARKG